jgi:hypothetical protein
MKAFPCSAWLALSLLTVPVTGCAETVETHPRQPLLVCSQPNCPGEVVVAEPAGAQVVAAPPDGQIAVAPGQPVVTEVAVNDLETWASRNPDAARALGTWVHNNPEAAGVIFKWDKSRPGRSRELVRWAIRHSRDDISVFTAKHPEWAWFDGLMASHRRGADQYLAWCRQYPAAAEELVRQSSGLRWVGDHLYASEWHPE